MSARELITASRLSAFRRCPRLHRIRYVDLVRPVEEASTLRFGTLVHAALEAWWRSILDSTQRWRAELGADVPYDPIAVLHGGDPLAAALAAIAARAPAARTGASCSECGWSGAMVDLRLGEDTPTGRVTHCPTCDSTAVREQVDTLTPERADQVRADEMLRVYDARWRMEALEPLAVEAEFVAALVNPATGARSQTYDLGGKLDVVVRRWHAEGGADVLLVEHKTSSEDVGPGSAYRRRLRMDGQVSLYHDGARSLGYDVVGCLYDVLGKPTLRPLRATPVEARKYTKDGRLYAAQRDRDESPAEYRDRIRAALGSEPDAYLTREEIVRLDAEMDEARADVWDTARTIRESEIAGRAPRNPAACQAYGRDCDYFGPCSGTASLDDPEMFRRADRAHEELATPAPVALAEEI